MGLRSFKFSWWAPNMFWVHKVKIILAPIERAYATSYWSAIVTLDYPCQRYCRLCAEKSDPPLFHPNFGVFPLDHIANAVAPRSEDPMLIIRVITFELTHHIRPRYINVTDGQTDGQKRTDIVHREVKYYSISSLNCDSWRSREVLCSLDLSLG